MHALSLNTREGTPTLHYVPHSMQVHPQGPTRDFRKGKALTISLANIGRSFEGADHNEAEAHEQEVHNWNIYLPKVL